MSNFFAIALFQTATIFGFNPSAQPNTNNSTSPQTAVGSGGWGNDITAKSTESAVGSGGWGNDVALKSTKSAVGSGGWGNDING